VGFEEGESAIGDVVFLRKELLESVLKEGVQVYDGGGGGEDSRDRERGERK
jgi:hypothetical protein